MTPFLVSSPHFVGQDCPEPLCCALARMRSCKACSVGLLDTRAFVPRREISSTKCSLFGATHTDGQLAFGIFQARTLQIPSGLLNCISSSPMPGPLDAPVGHGWARPLCICKHAGATALGSAWEAAGSSADSAGQSLPPSRGRHTDAPAEAGLF